MKSKTYNGQARSGEKDFETLQLGAFATPGLLLAQGPEGLTAESRLNKKEAVPGAVISIQTFGDLVNFHPHLHNLVKIRSQDKSGRECLAQYFVPHSPRKR